MSAASSSLWIVWVPQMNRTLESPKPQRARPSGSSADEAGIVGQAEVIVGAEVEDWAGRRP